MTTDAPRPAESDVHEAARRLLSAAAPPDYLEEWAVSLRRPVVEEVARGADSVVVFRLGDERYALSTRFVREIHHPRRVHPVPGRVNPVFRGIVCLRGEIHLCADLHALLGGARAPGDSPGPHARMVVVERAAERWAFEADEVVDLRAVPPHAVRPPQATVEKAVPHASDALLALEDGAASRLDADLLFSGLARSLA